MYTINVLKNDMSVKSVIKTDSLKKELTGLDQRAFIDVYKNGFKIFSCESVKRLLLDNNTSSIGYSAHVFLKNGNESNWLYNPEVAECLDFVIQEIKRDEPTIYSWKIIDDDGRVVLEWRLY